LQRKNVSKSVAQKQLEIIIGVTVPTITNYKAGIRKQKDDIKKNKYAIAYFLYPVIVIFELPI